MLQKVNTPVVAVVLLSASLALAQTNASKASAVGTWKMDLKLNVRLRTATEVRDFEHHQRHARREFVAGRRRGHRGQIRFVHMERPRRWHFATAERR